MDYLQGLKRITETLEELTNITVGVQQLEQVELVNYNEEIIILYRKELERLSLQITELEHTLYIQQKKYGKPHVLSFDETRIKEPYKELRKKK
jgi:hypothetical protein